MDASDDERRLMHVQQLEQLSAGSSARGTHVLDRQLNVARMAAATMLTNSTTLRTSAAHNWSTTSSGGVPTPTSTTPFMPTRSRPGPDNNNNRPGATSDRGGTSSSYNIGFPREKIYNRHTQPPPQLSKHVIRLPLAPGVASLSHASVEALRGKTASEPINHFAPLDPIFGSPSKQIVAMLREKREREFDSLDAPKARPHITFAAGGEPRVPGSLDCWKPNPRSSRRFRALSKRTATDMAPWAAAERRRAEREHLEAIADDMVHERKVVQSDIGIHGGRQRPKQRPRWLLGAGDDSDTDEEMEQHFKPIGEADCETSCREALAKLCRRLRRCCLRCCACCSCCYCCAKGGGGEGDGGAHHDRTPPDVTPPPPRPRAAAATDQQHHVVTGDTYRHMHV